MPHVNELRERKFLAKEDCGATGILVTIRAVDQANVAMSGAPEELKWVCHFDEIDRPMVLNGVNAQLLAGICGSEMTEDWSGHKVVLFHDPSVSFGGKLVGGIRVRAPRQQNKPAARSTPRPAAARPAPAPRAVPAAPPEAEDPPPANPEDF